MEDRMQMSGPDARRALIERLRTERSLRRGALALVVLNGFVVAFGPYKTAQVGGGVIAGAISAVVVIGLSAVACGLEIWSFLGFFSEARVARWSG
jgi:hypothetical protein